MVTILLYQGLWSLCSLWYWRLHQPSSCMTPLNKHWPIFHSLVYSQQSRNKTLISRSFLILEIPSIVDLFHAVHLMKSCHFLWLFSPFFLPWLFFLTKMFLTTYLFNEQTLFFLSNLINLGPQTLETWLMTVTSDMTNSSPSNLSCINALWKLIFSQCTVS